MRLSSAIILIDTMMGWRGQRQRGWRGVRVYNHLSVTITYMSGIGILLPPICSHAPPCTPAASQKRLSILQRFVNVKKARLKVGGVLRQEDREGEVRGGERALL